MVMQNKYYNSPSSLIASAQTSNVPNTRDHSEGHRRPDSSSQPKPGSQSHKSAGDFARIANLKANAIIKNTKTNISMKHRKSENLRKIKARASGNNSSGKYSSKSSYIMAPGSNIMSLKGSQNLFVYNANSSIGKPQENTEELDTKQFITTGKLNFWLPAIGGSGGTDGIYKLAGNLVQKLPNSKDVKASKAAKTYLKNAMHNEKYISETRKFSTISKSSKGKKDHKDHMNTYNNSKDKIVKAYKHSLTHHGNYSTEPVKGHKRSSSDSQQLYDLNKWTILGMC